MINFFLKNKILVLTLIFLIIIGFLIFLKFFSKNVFLITGSQNIFLNNENKIAFLFLGKPGVNYLGGENTDSIIVFYYDENKNILFLIPIPRDLIVKDKYGNLVKINSLYESNQINLLLQKVSNYTGLKIKDYIVVDLNLIKKITDFLGGLEVEIKEPVIDAVTLYTIPPGRHLLNGDLIELVLRSRYNPRGDFFRIENQINVIKALKDKIASINNHDKISLIDFVMKNKAHWHSNISPNQMLKWSMKISNIKTLRIVPIILDTKNNSLLKSNNLTIYNEFNVYGIYPSDGIDNYSKLSLYIQSKIKENLNK